MEYLIIGVLGAIIIAAAMRIGRDNRRRGRRAKTKPSNRHTQDRTKRRSYNAATSKPVEDPIQITGSAYVIDGDTIVIKNTQIRLFGIDAPELDHPYGKKAKWAMVALCKGHEVRATVTATDDHGRTVAKCYLPDGRDLSAELTKQGLAIDWPKFSGGEYRSLETPDARKKLWLADARQKGRIHVWEQFEARRAAKAK